jgi:hypothetical protein
MFHNTYKYVTEWHKSKDQPMTCLCRNRKEALEGVRGQHHDPTLLTLGKSQYSLYVEKTTWASGPI